MKEPADDFRIRNAWHVVAAQSDLPPNTERRTVLLGTPLLLRAAAPGKVAVGRAAGGPSLPVLLRYGYVWTSLGEPDKPLFEIPEFAEPDRRNVHSGSVGVQVSAPRAIENFLDLGHFPFVHTDLLGAEPLTEVKQYEVALSDDGDEILATRCRFTQPRGAANAPGSYEVEYVYRVPHPFCSILYKINPIHAERWDVIAMFAQPVGEERTIAHMLLSLIDDSSSDTELRSFQLMIFAQDKPILENQRPRRLPLDPRAEMPVRADASSLAYRRWLAQQGVRYGTIPAAAGAEQAA